MNIEDSDYSEFIDKNNDETFVLVKSLVDYYLVYYSETYNLFYEVNQRNHLIIKTYNLIRKKYLCSPNSHWDNNKKSIVAIIVKGYLANEVA